ncbi:hypothetical protein FOIG_04649 [Fusarium odoratissimum NRRL 54006]|uniref:Uncharacterized protein n=2 Tax=Fusarium oxysporum species complex TaxID=171631 RepID=X0JTB8_FUSO5|nr:uncharacterized protein FOIG_04649 [Fusarium odoratissimum NRRL 54006]EXM04433.1 hypothetical protein FOIG_04649 [Fusarium odoratissimum NRRL 54006]TXB98158.1 hypothetical protein FocTR4_00012369 [Fusarium oxysporum f. sp. cubense]
MANAQCYNCIYANGAPSCDACPSAIPNGCGGCIGGCPAAEGGTSSSYEVDLIRFRVISAIRLQRRFGFVEQREDVESMDDQLVSNGHPGLSKNLSKNGSYYNPWAEGRSTLSLLSSGMRSANACKGKYWIIFAADYEWLK